MALLEGVLNPLISTPRDMAGCWGSGPSDIMVDPVIQKLSGLESHPAPVGGMRQRLPSRLAISTQSDEQTGHMALRLVMIQLSMPLCPMSPLEDESGVSLRFHL